MLPGWAVWNANDVTVEKPKRKCGVITTERAAHETVVSAGVLIRATGTKWTLPAIDWPWMGDVEEGFLIDFADEYHPLAARNAELRMTEYAEHGRMVTVMKSKKTATKHHETTGASGRSLWAESGCAATATVCRELLAIEPAPYTFAAIEGVEPTNNAAERALRHAVCWRKMSHGTDSAGVSRFVERVLTVVATCRQQGRGVLAFLTDAVQDARAGAGGRRSSHPHLRPRSRPNRQMPLPSTSHSQEPARPKSPYPLGDAV